MNTTPTANHSRSCYLCTGERLITLAQSAELAARRAAEDADRAMAIAREYARACHSPACHSPAAYAASAAAFDRWHTLALKAASLAALLPPNSHL